MATITVSAFTMIVSRGSIVYCKRRSKHRLARRFSVRFVTNSREVEFSNQAIGCTELSPAEFQQRNKKDESIQYETIEKNCSFNTHLVSTRNRPRLTELPQPATTRSFRDVADKELENQQKNKAYDEKAPTSVRKLEERGRHDVGKLTVGDIESIPWMVQS